MCVCVCSCVRALFYLVYLGVRRRNVCRYLYVGQTGNDDHMFSILHTHTAAQTNQQKLNVNYVMLLCARKNVQFRGGILQYTAKLPGAVGLRLDGRITFSPDLPTGSNLNFTIHVSCFACVVVVVPSSLGMLCGLTPQSNHLI